MRSQQKRVRIPRELAERMVAHCLAEKPNEACGVLAAAGDEVVSVLPISNADASPVRYSFDPYEQLAAYRTLDERGWQLGGVYHSHTRTEAYPSPTDVARPTEDVPYVIVSLAADPPAIRAFRIVKDNWTDETGDVEEVPVEIAG